MPSVEALFILVPIFVVAYTVFAMVGFGSTLISAPIAGHLVPLPVLIPAQALLDLAAAIGSGINLSTQVVKAELWRLLPAMVLGMGLGTYILLTVPVQALMVVLGAFVVFYALRGMRPQAPRPPIAPVWGSWYGFIGGVFSAMFGAGAWLYAIYLVRRVEDHQAIRATQITMIAGGAVIRVAMFGLAGQYSNWNVTGLSLALFPAMVLGVFVGNRVAHRLNRARFLRVLYVVLLCTGTALFIRGVLEAW